MKIVQHAAAWLMLMAFVMLGLIYSVVNPVFEAGDETRHYAVVKYMADTGQLPLQDEAIVGEAMHHWEHEGNQPPLYYGIAALLTAWLDTGTWDDVYWYNPHTTIGDPLRQDNKNIVIHPPHEAWTGAVLAVHLLRLFSLMFATITVGLSYHIALMLFRGERGLALGAMALTAFNPMFIFISAAVNNDNAVIMFVTLALWWMIRLGLRKSPSQWWHMALLGLLIGLGALSKLYAVGLLPLAGLWLIWLAYRQSLPTDGSPQPINKQQIIRLVLTWSLVLGGTVFLVAGWFYLRNMWLYGGDPLALQSMRDTAGTREHALTLATLWAEFEGLRIAYWALFGGVNLLATPLWVYTLLDALSLVAVVGLSGFMVEWGWRRAQPPYPRLDGPTFGLLGGWCLIMLGGFIVWNLTQPATQGRLFYPAIAAISAMFLLGLAYSGWRLLGERWVGVIVGGVTAGLFLFAFSVPWLTMPPAYAPKPIITTVPPDVTLVDLTYDETIRLIGYQLHTPHVRPAQTVELTLYWELLQPTEMNYSIFIHLLGRDRLKITQRDSYPGGGTWPTSTLQPGDIVVDNYAITVPPLTEYEHAPTQLLIAVGIYDYFEAGRPGRVAINSQGEAVEPIIGRLKLTPWDWPNVSVKPQATRFLDQVTLADYALSPQGLTLTWQVHQPMGVDYTVFIQAWDAETQQQIAGFDGMPVNGNYPTSLWDSGDIVVDQHSLGDLTEADYLLVGLYNRETGARLPAFESDGALPEYAVRIELGE